MADQRRSSMGDGIREGLGILNAFKEAVEETFEEAMKQTGANQDGARSVLRDAADRLQQTIDEARDRFEPVPRKEFEELRAEVGRLKARLDVLEAPGGSTGDGAQDSGFTVD